MENQNSDQLHNQEDVNPSSQLDKLTRESNTEDLPETTGTGANRAVPTSGSVIIDKDDEDNGESNDIEELGHS